MKTYKIEIQEFLSKIVEVKANTADEAIILVGEMYKNEEIVLGSENFVCNEIGIYNHE